MLLTKTAHPPGRQSMKCEVQIILSLTSDASYSDVSIKNIDILPNRQYIANTADSAQERYS